MTIQQKPIFYGLLAAIGLQLAVLLLEYGGAIYPLLTGQEIRLKVIPVDPRSLFRGNYARLNYDISNIRYTKESLGRRPRQNELVYVSLKQDDDGFYIADGISLTEPATGIFIRGRSDRSFSERLRLRYGIEAFFAPKEKALKLEKELRYGATALVMLASNGKATLKDVVTQQ